MASITMTDLPESQTLNPAQMTARRGGQGPGAFSGLGFANVGIDINVNQQINQAQALDITAANNVANFGLFAPKISPTLSQSAPVTANLFT